MASHAHHLSQFRRYFEHQGGGFVYLDDAILVAATALGCVVLILIGNGVIRGIRKAILKRRVTLEREQRTKTFLSVFRGFFITVVLFVGVIVILNVFKVNPTPILASAGVVGVILGLGAQAIIKDILAGFFILLEDQFAVGDVIEVSAVSGVVEEMSLRTTLLRDMDGSAHIIPNGGIGVVTNFTRGWSRADLKIPVAADEEADAVIAVLKDECRLLESDAEFARLLDGPPEVLGVDNFDALAFSVRVLIKTKPGEQWAVRREFRRRVLRRFAADGIRLPNTQRVVFADRGDAPRGD